MKIDRNVDLHNHTTGSDGKQSPLRFLLRAKRRGKNIVSITDHSSIKGYKQLEEQVRYYAEKSLKDRNIVTAKRLLRVLDNENLIPGIEIITSYKGVIVEVLGYNIDEDILDSELQEKSKGLKTTKEVLYAGLSKVIEETGITFDHSVIENVNALVGPFYNELMRHPENKAMFEDMSTVDTLKKFIYNYLYNPESKFFVDMSETRPKLEEVIEMIHKAGGKASLAHPGRYKSLDMTKELDSIIELGLDAIEVSYPDHTPEFQRFLLAKAREHGIEISGGNDDHCNPKEGEQYVMGKVNVPSIKETEWIEDSTNFMDKSSAISEFRKRLKVMIDEEEQKKAIQESLRKKEIQHEKEK